MLSVYIHGGVLQPASISMITLYNTAPMKRIISTSAAILASAAMLCGQQITREHKERAGELVRQMTLEEKITYLGGYRDGFYIRPIERLGIPEIRMADGPQGVRNDTRSTLFACGVAAAATWNPETVYEMGAALGQDARARGVHILLGPGLNIYRSPLCGRNFEYMGEDPFLTASMAVSYIKGVQGQGVMATAKHFALNNQEYDRHHVSSDADERTMNEIYLPAFKAAVQQAGVGSVMTSYNPVNNVHAAENTYLIRETLKGRWGFDGFVMSDWTSTYSTLGCVKGGLDLEMPRAFQMTVEDIMPLIGTGVIREEEIDEKVQAILQTIIAFGFLDRPQKDISIPEDNPYSRDVAYRMACEAPVLLKNNGILPLREGKKNRIVILGPNADRIPCGGGSGKVDPIHSTSLAQGLKTLGKGYNVLSLSPDDGSRYDSEENIAAIREAEAVIVSVGFDTRTEKENSDRTFTLPEGQDEIIELALEHNRNVIVVIYAGGGVDMSRWHDRASAILIGWYPGQEGGLAIAHMLAGRISPSGRLPMSIEARPEDNPTAESYYPGEAKTKRGFTNRYVTYSEGVFVGYRGYDRTGTKPLYPFGHGLTYSEFVYSDLDVKEDGEGFEVSFTIKNNGKHDAAETPQVYVGATAPSLPRPLKELKGFRKTFVEKGKSKRVTIHLDREAFSFYDTGCHAFNIEPGTYRIMVGASAEDIRISSEITIQ